jgi:osmotically-inducible protein OsmY
VRSSSALLLAIGALTGLALGAVLADRVGGLDRLLPGRKSRKRRDESPASADGFEIEDDEDDEALFVSAQRDGGTTDSPYADDDDDDDDDQPSASMAGEGYGEGHAHHAMPDDTDLEERVLEAFHNDPVLAERAIDIGAIGTGVIELTGWVQASWEIGHAVTLARGVPDVTTVVDRLAVRDGERRRDHSGRHYSGDTAREPSDEEAPQPRAD